jgi:hypothetical protein
MSAELKSVKTAQLRLTNTGSKRVEFWLEPWGRLYSLDPQSSIDVLFEAESAGVPEVFHEPDRIVVYGWPTATARVMKDGVELVDQSQA